MSDTTDTEEFAKVLASVDGLVAPLASRAMAIALEAVKEAIQVYPPQPSRTRAKTFNTYVRGHGNYPRSAFVQNAKSPGGFKIKKGAKAIRMTSQQMDKKFKMVVEPEGAEVVGELRNEASYSGLVIGWESDDPKQVGFHAETGWVSANKALQKAEPVMTQAYEMAIDELLQKLAG